MLLNPVQVKHVPAFLNVACLHTQMTTRQKEIVLDKIKQKKLDILLVSPEAICSGLFGLLRNVEDFPPIAFACIDEVHCVSEWSHNFRPSYLKLCKVSNAFQFYVLVSYVVNVMRILIRFCAIQFTIRGLA